MAKKGGIGETLIAMSGNQNVVTVRKPYVMFTGDFGAGVLLDQLLYWSTRGARKDGLIYKSDSELADETCLSEYMIRQGRKVLVDMGIIATEIKRCKGHPTTHYRLHIEELEKQWEAWIEEGMPDRREKEEPPDKVACPYCGREFTQKGLNAHIKKWCKANPESKRYDPDYTPTANLQEEDTPTANLQKAETENPTANLQEEEEPSANLQEGQVQICIRPTANLQEHEQRLQQRLLSKTTDSGESENFEETGDSPGTAGAVSADAESHDTLPGNKPSNRQGTPESPEAARTAPNPKKPPKNAGGQKQKRPPGDPYQIFDKLKRIVKNDGLPEGPSLKAIRKMLDDGYTPGDVLNCAAYLMTAEWIGNDPTMVVDGYFVQKRIARWVADGRPKKHENGRDKVKRRVNRAASTPEEIAAAAEAQKERTGT